MSANILDGTLVRNQLLEKLKTKIKKHVDAGHQPPGLAVVLVGLDSASSVYVNSKTRTCESIGIESFSHHLPATISQTELIELIDKLNCDDSINGILVQLPLPDHISPELIIGKIVPGKDVDGFLPINLGRLALNQNRLSPCTPKGIMTLLRHYDIPLMGQEVVVVGTSRIVGRPITLEMLNERATVTVCSSKTRDLAAHIRRADVVVVAAGVNQLVKGDWIKPGAVVVDVGIHRNDDGSLSGDVEFNVAVQRAAWITPVPGGVGPMTIATLMENTVIAAGL